jgi:YcaO-like protein with predicted kinase domain
MTLSVTMPAAPKPPPAPHRSRSPEETLAALTPYLPGFGITRIANVTGLDRIGVPVFMVVRPNGRGLAVSQGKGLDAASAKVSGLMESIECHHAEYTRLPVRLESYRRLKTEGLVVDPELLPRSRTSRYSPSLGIAWTTGLDLVSGLPIWVPFELVHADFSHPAPPGGGCFPASTNGLASGNRLAEAILHGLCEVVERDALALWEARREAGGPLRRIDLGTARLGVCGRLIAQVERAGMSVMLWDMTSDVGVAAVRAAIFDTSADDVFNPTSAALGFGCHPTREVALIRALTEAAQSRLTAISGSRDDQTRTMYRTTQSAATLALHRLEAAEPGTEDFAAVPSHTGRSTESDLAHVLARLEAIGVSRVAMVDLSRPRLPVSVVRVIVPGLEGPSESSLYVPGPRAHAARSR